MRNFPGLFQSPRMLKYKEKEAQGPKGRQRGGVLGEGQRAPSPPARESGEHCKVPNGVRGENFKFGATRDIKIHYRNALMHNFQKDIFQSFQDLKLQFPGVSRTKVIFQHFSGPGILKKKIHDFAGVGTIYALGRHTSGKRQINYNNVLCFIHSRKKN